MSVQSASQIERDHVHSVYEAIGSHFSETRYKPWPLIERFLGDLPSGYVGLDAGSGNGKYLGLGSVLHRGSSGKTLLIGLDHIARSRGHEVVHADGMAMPWRDGVFDFAISIATIHHFASLDRRKMAVQSLLRALNPRRGRLLIQVWALEQGDEATRLKGKGRQTVPLPGGEGEQDALIPWKLQEASHHVSAVHHRYYRLFKEGELLSLVQGAAHELGIATTGDGSRLSIEQAIFERGNWLLEARFM